MKTISFWLIVGMLVFGALGGNAGVFAQDTSLTSGLEDMLSYVPSEFARTESGWATVRFVDYEALLESEGQTLLRALGTVDLLMSAVPLGSILGRITAGPEALTYLFASAGHMADVVGFEWLLDVDCSLEFGDPPNMGLLLGGDFDEQKIAGALESRGFSLTELEGVPVWHRFDDLEISLTDRDVADPFGGHLGAAARVALFPEILANARTWPLIEAIVGAGQTTRPSLGNDAVYRALADAVTQAGGHLIQALFFSETALRLGDDAAQSGQEQVTDADLLPRYLGAALADRQEGSDQVNLIALVCEDEPTARTAAEVLARRVAQFLPASRTGDVLVDQVGATVSIREVGPSEDDLFIAVVEARYPVPAERIDPETGQYNLRGLLFRAWVQSILYREFTVLQ